MKIPPIAIDGLAVLICASLQDCYSIEQLAVIGAFFNVIGDVLSLNTSYLSLFTDNNTSNDENNNDIEGLDLLKESIEKIQKELENMKKTAQ